MLAHLRERLSSISLRESLTRDILQKFEAVKESEQTARKKKRWCETLEHHIGEVCPAFRLILVGSSTTGFAIEGCDVDLTLVRPQAGSLSSSIAADSNLRILWRIEERLSARAYSINTEGEASILKGKTFHLAVTDQTLSFAVPELVAYDLVNVAGEPLCRTELEHVHDVLISTAVVPILKLKDRSETLEGDISVDVKSSLFNTYLQKCYGKMDPRVTPLIVIVKYWAKRSGITGARDHKLSGFAVVLLVIYYLQRGCTPPTLPCLQSVYPSHFNTSWSASFMADKLMGASVPSVITSYKSENTDTLGELLVGFFDYYNDFNWSQVLSVRQGGSKPVPTNKKWTRPCIRIEDPFDETNVTRAVYKILQFSSIKGAFREARQKIMLGRARLEDVL